MSLLEIVRLLRRKPGMMLGTDDPTFRECVALLQGYDAAAGSLAGFREFLILRLDGGANLVWQALVLHLAFPGNYHQPSDEAENQIAVSTLLDLVTEFLAEVASGHGRDRILHEYGTWLREQTWYEPDLERLDQHPAPEVMGADDAAEALGIRRVELFENLRELGLHPLRMGAEVVFRTGDVQASVDRRS